MFDTITAATACDGNDVEKPSSAKNRNTGKTSLPDAESARVVAEIRKYFDEQCDGNMTELGRWLGISRTSAENLYKGTNKPGFTTAMQVATRRGKPWVELLSGLPFMDLKQAADRMRALEEQIDVMTSSLRRLEAENANLRAQLLRAPGGISVPPVDASVSAKTIDSGGARLRTSGQSDTPPRAVKKRKHSI